MIVPDTRAQYVLSAKGKDEKNPYWDGNLTGDNKKFIEGFDFALQTVLNMFDNLDNYYEDFVKCGLKSDKFINSNNQYVNGINLFVSEKSLPDITTLNSVEFDKLSKEEQIFGTLKYAINRWTEAERDSVITSLIDEQAND